MDRRTCTRCKVEKSIDIFRKDITKKLGRDSWCLDCRRAYDRERNRTPERLERAKKFRTSERGRELGRIRDRKNYWVNRHKYAAKRIIEEMVKSGELLKEPCKICGDNRVFGHHPDYSKPKEVIWLCQQHHWDAHRGV